MKPVRNEGTRPLVPQKQKEAKMKDEPSGDTPEETEEELDEGLEESFPASDPPANVQPGHEKDIHKEKDRKKD